MKCLMCKGTLIDKPTNFIADLETSIIIVKNVPSQVCPQCGEVSYSDHVARQLEKIVNSMKNLMMEIAIVDYADRAA